MKKTFDWKMAEEIPITEVSRLKDNTPVFVQCKEFWCIITMIDTVQII